MTSTKLEQPYTLATSRWAVLTIFFINGAGAFNWASRIPQVKEALGFEPGTLGLALLGMSTGVIIGLLLAGGFITRFSSRTVTTVASIGFALAFPIIGLAINFVTLFASLMIFGFCMSIMDMAMNTQASEIERRLGKSVMSSFHAAFSIGGIAGGLMGAGAIALSLSVLTHFTLIAVLLLLVTLIARVPLMTIQGETDTKEASSVITLPHPALWALGAVAFSATIGEGSMIDWSAIYLKDVVGSTESVAAYGLIAFSTLMTVGRLTGDWLAARYSAEMLVRGGGVVAATGLLLAMAIPQTAVVIVGFGLVGAGMSIIVPLAFSAAGNMPGIPAGQGIAGVASIGYAGFLAGPPVIGLLADVTSMRIAMTFVLILVATLFFSGRTIRNAKLPH
jgi:fucose permease